MFCIKCGKELPQEAAFCPSCGTAIKKEENYLVKEFSSNKNTGKKILEDINEWFKKEQPDIKRVSCNCILGWISITKQMPILQKVIFEYKPNGRNLYVMDYVRVFSGKPKEDKLEKLFTKWKEINKKQIVWSDNKNIQVLNSGFFLAKYFIYIEA